MGAALFILFGFGLILGGFIWMIFIPVVYNMKTDVDIWGEVATEYPAFLTTRDTLYSIYEFTPMIILFIGILFVITGVLRNRNE